MPFEMSYVKSVKVQGAVYVGGGYADDDSDNELVVMTYDTSAGKWATLPPYSTRWFAMTAINNHLVLVGGRGRVHYSKRLAVWRAGNANWTHPYPDMTTPRHSCSTVVYKHWLAVAGGWGESGMLLSSVEVIDTKTKQWYAGPQTPTAWSSMITTTVRDMCYFIGGYIGGGYTNMVYRISLPALVSQLNSESSAKDTQMWKEMPQLPVMCAAPLSIERSLLAVGGYDKDSEDVSALHLYQPDAGQWVKVADMPTPRSTCTSIMTADKQLIVAGGYHNKDRLSTMYLAQIC